MNLKDIGLFLLDVQQDVKVLTTWKTCFITWKFNESIYKRLRNTIKLKTNRKEELKRKLNFYKDQVQQLQQENFEIDDEIRFERKSLANKLKMEFFFKKLSNNSKG